MEWWQTYFDEHFFALHEDLFPEQDSRAEVAALIDMAGLESGSVVLDAPCGWGRHTELLREAGVQTFGADLSFDLLKRATSSGAYAAADLRALPYRAGTFDCVLNLFTSLGLFADSADDTVVIEEAARVLKQDGVFILESMHRDEVIAKFAARDAWTLPNGIQVEVRRRFDPVSGISHERLRWSRDDRTGEKRHTLRLRTATEIDALLRPVFQNIQYFGDWDGRPLRHRSPRVIALCRR